MKKILDWDKYLKTAADTVAEGIVMLKNNNSALPLKKGEIISVFGRIQLHYYKSGTGSGGMVNVSKVTNIPDGLIEAGITLNEELLNVYKKWDAENPYDLGDGWGAEPWSQAEMPLDDETVENAAKKGSTALVIIGRTAGEEQDVRREAGSYLLTDTEKSMITKVRAAFEKVVVLLNVGGLIDIEFIESCNVDSLLYIWQGGMTGGSGTAAVLSGIVSPSGKLPDTIAYSLDDYPSTQYFGDTDKSVYGEDIYVGYRYFNTFAPEKIRYPFGFGLSYTKFRIAVDSVKSIDRKIIMTVTVTNIGEFKGKEVVMMYERRPQGKLGQPDRILCAYEKTRELAPSESQTVELSVNLNDTAAYDDSGVSGNRFCWILEKGDHSFFVEGDVKNTVYSYKLAATEIVKSCSQVLAPNENFKRIKPAAAKNGFDAVMESVPISEVNENARRMNRLPAELEYSGDKGIKLADVYNGVNTMDEFIAQFSDEQLACIIRGEGMGSPRVTAGTASAFGGVADCLTDMGIPAACCSDGPSGMRLDCGTKAFSLPNGTMIASTFNTALVEELFEYMGLEMAANKVDTLLGPGMNIHRNPLNGRNFEYFSEDPYLTGTMAAAELRGMHKSGVTGTVKHFCANNKEANRRFLDSVVSERALREIYLKGFEIAVKDGNADSIMTTYGKINGLWTSSNFDLNTVILREEWGFDGISMTDWWANLGRRGTKENNTDFASMTIAQNDLYMVCADGGNNDDNTVAALESGELKRGEIQRNAANICRFLLNTNAMKRLMGIEDEIEIINRPDDEIDSCEPVVYYDLDKELTLDLRDVKAEKGKSYSFGLTVSNPGWYKVTVTASSTQSAVAQIPLTLFCMGTANATFTWNGTNGEPVSFSKEIPMFSHFTATRLYFAQNGLDLIDIKFEKTENKKLPVELGG